MVFLQCSQDFHLQKKDCHMINKVVVITGGNRGIGAATARLAAADVASEADVVRLFETVDRSFGPFIDVAGGR
jgi:NAD(P)-dependent dehydrogenase (short-subunit alcohol dehydrogenase family)